MVGAGAFVRFGGELGDVYEGFLPARRMRGERFELNEPRRRWSGRRTGGAVRLGDPVAIRVEPDRGAARPGRPRARPAGARSQADGEEGKAQGGAPATWPPTGAPATSTSCSRSFECGIELRGTEVKSLRDGKAQIDDAYAVVEDGEVWLRNAAHPALPAGGRSRTTSPSARASCCSTGDEIERLIGTTAEQRGLTLIPTRIYFKGPRRRSSWRWPAARRGATAVARSPTATSAARSSANSSSGCAEPTVI